MPCPALLRCLSLVIVLCFAAWPLGCDDDESPGGGDTEPRVLSECSELEGIYPEDGLACSFRYSCNVARVCCDEHRCGPTFVCTCSGGRLDCYNTDFYTQCADLRDPLADVGASDVTDALDVESDVDTAACPDEMPDSGARCTFVGRCDWGESCCGETCLPAFECSCDDGNMSCLANDYHLSCHDTVDAQDVSDLHDTDASDTTDTTLPGRCRSEADCASGELCTTEDDALCGACMTGEPCASDADCTGGNVCGGVPPSCPCSPGDPVCTPPCATSDDCDPGDTCDSGHCVATSCQSDLDCAEHFACDASSHTCARALCESDADCAAEVATCVHGACYAQPGTCLAPVP